MLAFCERHLNADALQRHQPADDGGDDGEEAGADRHPADMHGRGRVNMRRMLDFRRLHATGQKIRVLQEPVRERRVDARRL